MLKIVARDTCALKEAKDKLAKHVEELTWRLDIEKHTRTDLEEAKGQEISMLGNNVIGGSMDTICINGPRYHEAANNGISANFMAPPINLRHPNIPPVVAPFASTPQDGMNMGPTQPLAIPSPALGIFRPPLICTTRGSGSFKKSKRATL